MTSQFFSSKKPVIALVGPTASGKSELAQLVAKEINGEIISADSMQVYRGMDIGTAKLPADKRYVHHYMIDILDPGQDFSAQQFQIESRYHIARLQNLDIVPIICGGTGLYVQACLEDMQFPKGEYQGSLRIRLNQLLEEKGSEYLWNELNKKDPESAQIIHPNNSRRVIRALEMNSQGVSYAQQSRSIKTLKEVVPSLRFGLQVDPDALRKRIDKRVDAMISAGLVDEVNTLLRSGFEEALTAKEAIGYKEIVLYLKGVCTLEEAIEKIKIATHRYAKRQRSWFKRDKRIIWLNADSLSREEMKDYIISHYREL